MKTLSPVIVRFAATCLFSVEDLRVLTLCVEGREHWYDASAVSQELEIPRRTARATLDHLARCNLLDIRITGDVRYRFRPGTSDLEAQALTVVEAYRRNPLQVLETIGGDVGRGTRNLGSAATKNPGA